MEASYVDLVEDIAHFRSLGASEATLTRMEGVVNHYFCLIQLYDQMKDMIEKQTVTIARLQEQLFGRGDTYDGEVVEAEDNKDEDEPNPAASNDTQVEDEADTDNPEDDGSDASEADPKNNTEKEAKPKGNRTGRRSADDYTGAPTVECTHESLTVGDTCPQCEQGRLYEDESKKKIKIDATPPLFAVCYILQVLRCALCGARFTASAPVDLKDKYTAQARSMLAYLHCGMGMPYNRLAILQDMVGMPVPASTQSHLLEGVMGPIYPIFYELMYQLANSDDVIYQDDTHVKIIELMRENQLLNPERKGMFSTAFVTESPHPIVLYITGRQHAGENFDDLMKHRDDEKEAPKRMADALSANSSHESSSINLNCNAHAVRRFKSIKTIYPQESREILVRYRKVYQHKAHCSAHKYTPKETLAYHQAHSAPLMDEIKALIKHWFDERRVEPNSALGRELKYLINHWEELTQFLRVEGATLDNNLCERILKVLIMYRKNSQIYVTEYSAYNLHLITSLIATCRLNEVDFIIYMTCLQHYEEQVWACPDQWLPWNYQQTLEAQGQSPPTYATLRQSSAMAA